MEVLHRLRFPLRPRPRRIDAAADRARAAARLLGDNHPRGDHATSESINCHADSQAAAQTDCPIIHGGMLGGRPWCAARSCAATSAGAARVPTANLDPEREVLPAPGVYAGTLRSVDAAIRPPRRGFAGVTERRAPADLRRGDKVLAEAHARDWRGDLYGRRVELSFPIWLARSGSFRASTRCARRSPPMRTRRATGSPSVTAPTGARRRRAARSRVWLGVAVAVARGMDRAARRRPARPWSSSSAARAGAC